MSRPTADNGFEDLDDGINDLPVDVAGTLHSSGESMQACEQGVPSLPPMMVMGARLKRLLWCRRYELHTTGKGALELKPTAQRALDDEAGGQARPAAEQQLLFGEDSAPYHH